MRHAKKVNHLGRTNTHRKAMLSNMASSLILHKRIATTVAKAKALRTYVEPLITRSKDDTTHSRRMVFSYLQDKQAVSELFREVSPKIMERPGGYTRILRTGIRKGDTAEMCIIELVDYNLNMLDTKDTKKAATRRSRRGGKKAGAVAAAAGTAAEKTATQKPSVIEEATIVVEEATKLVEEEATKVVEEAAKPVEEAESKAVEKPAAEPVIEDAKIVEEVKNGAVEETAAVEETVNEAAEATETEAPAAEDTKE
jgi:large subunit ribosomal protein L17